MKVLLIDNYHYRKGGAEVVYLNMGDILREHGHEVIYFSQKWPDNYTCQTANYFPAGVSVNAKGICNKFKCISHYFYNEEAAKCLERLIMKDLPDIAHIHLFWGGLSPSIYKILKKYRIPIVHTVHDYRMVCPGYTFKNWKGEICEKCEGHRFYKCILNKCAKGSLAMSTLMSLEIYLRNTLYHPADYIDYFIYVSHFALNKHLQYDKKLCRKASDVLYNFTNSDILAYKQNSIDTFNSYYLYYGRLSYEKGISTLIKAFVRFPHLHLKVAGTGPLDKELKATCSQYNATNIEFIGYKTGKDLYDLVSGAKFVCVPSEWYENNPMTIIEAYSLCTPVIGARIGGITEIISDKITGYLFTSGDIDDLCRNLDKSCELGREDYLKMKINAEEFADKNFNKEIYYRRIIKIYNMLITNSQPH